MPSPWTISPVFILLVACSSPPRPPDVDESQKRPANSQMAVELQTCKHELVNGRILAAESGRLANTAAATLVHMAARQQASASAQQPANSSTQANVVFTIHFAFASSRVDAATEATAMVIAEAKAVPLVLLRGRTDSLVDTAADARIARQRAIAVRDVLVAAGVPMERIRVTWQASGDLVTDDRSPEGRSRNRRVEIELYRQVPAVAPVSGPRA